jgi:HAD superfamily hydrolase (TIGR01509 family)
MILIFDCDGVVLDSMVLHTEVEAEAYRSLGVDITPSELSLRFSGVPQNEVSRILSNEKGVNIPSDLEGLIESTKEKVFSERLKPISGIAETLEDLRSIPRCIASGTAVSGLRHMLGVTGLYDSFAPHIYSSEMVERGKPFPDLFLYAANRMGANPDECLVIEDGIAGVQAAKAASMRVLGFVGGSHCDSQHAQRLEGAGAEFVFDNMRDLVTILKERV